jgi:anti-sigma regulatory factor (Ser/Thr protein kinase)
VRLVEQGYLRKTGSGTRPTYTQGDNRFWLATLTRVDIAKCGDEQGIWELYAAGLLADLPAHLRNLVAIGFTEMVNNAIDHSQATHLCLAVHVAQGQIEVAVMDDGIGVFRNIAQAMNLFDDRLAILELAKGKYTTASSGHSGMGVFVTSRLFDRFVIRSQGLSYAPRGDLRFGWLDEAEFHAGSVVLMAIAQNATRTAHDVYAKYFDPEELGGEAFHTTEVPVKLAQLSSQLISRSQGKWVTERATEFKTVVLDFEGVDSMGQGFCDEVFRVFASAHPEVTLKVSNQVPAVQQAMRMFAAHWR